MEPRLRLKRFSPTAVLEHRFSSLRMPTSDPRDIFFYLHHTPMKDTYSFHFMDIFLIYIYIACLSWALVKICVCPSFLFSIEGEMWDVIVLIPDHCLYIYFL